MVLKIIEQSHEILHIDPNINQMIEKAGRTCYKSEDKITGDSADKFVKMLIDRGHHAMIEFGDIIVKFVTSRDVTHEFVRHRLCSFAQESQRYVRYNNIEFIRPVWESDKTEKDVLAYSWWKHSMITAENHYKHLMAEGWTPQQARVVLPNSAKTEIVVKTNIREWRYIFQLRCSPKAYPQLRFLMLALLKELKEKVPVVFEDINYE